MSKTVVMKRPQGRLDFEYELDEKVEQNVTAWGGLPFVGEVMSATGVDAAIKEHMRLLHGRREFDETELIRALVLLHAAGGDCLDDLGVLRNDLALSRLLGRALPAPETVRQFLYLFHEDFLVEAAKNNLPEGRKAYVPEESPGLRGLNRVVQDLVKYIQGRWPESEATVDVDATFQESHKKEAKDHYEGGPGYQPILATWVEQKVVVYDEFRDGNVAPHHDAAGVVKRAFAALPEGIARRKMRGDAAMYSLDALRWLCSEHIEFAIGAQVRAGLRGKCEALAAESWVEFEMRPDSVLHLAEVDYVPKDWGEQDPKLRFIAIRLTPIQSELFDEQRSVQHLVVVTNRPEAAAEIVRWYWAKGGTIEHVHDVLKNELGAGVLPCGRFGANAAWFRLAVLTYNLLRVMRAVGPQELRDARPKRLRLHLLAIPAIVVNHARTLLARIAQHCAALIQSRELLWRVSPNTA